MENTNKHYTIVSYRPDGDDYCRGCHMASSSSDFDLQETEDMEEAARLVADRLIADHQAQNAREVREWQVYILIDGRSQEDEADCIKDRAQAIFVTWIEDKKKEKEIEQARLKEEADQKKEAARIAKLAHERAEYERLKQVYG